ncbi:MAG: histidine kinase [Chitinophagaceae bacterium]
MNTKARRLIQKARISLDQEDWNDAIRFSDSAVIISNSTRDWSALAASLSIQAAIAQYYNDDFQQEEKLSLQAIAAYRKTADSSEIGNAYYTYAFSRFAQSDYLNSIYYLQMAISAFKASGNNNREVFALITLSNIYSEKGIYDTAFTISQQALNLARETSNTRGASKALLMAATIYYRIGEYDSALSTHQKARELLQKETTPRGKTLADLQFAETLARLRKWEDAANIYRSIDSTHMSEQEYRFYLVSKGEFAMETNQYKMASDYLEKGLQLHRVKKDGNEIMRALSDLAVVSLALNKPKESLAFGFEALEIARTVGSKQGLLSAYESIYQTFKNEKKYDSALHYFSSYVAMKDTVMSAQAKGQIAAYTFQQVISRLHAENTLRDEKVASIGKEKRLILIAAGIAILLFIAVGWNMRLQRSKAEHLRQLAFNQLEQEKLLNERNAATLQRQKADLEMKMLRAQMNPHFIFNSLNAINMYILQSNTELASEYLTQFSKLVRMILQHSRHELIALEDEITALKLYLEMENIRFNAGFGYSFVITEDVDTFSLKIPPMVIQPFVENAIWHGLMKKQGRGSLQIIFSVENDCLVCQVMDNGIGRAKAKQLEAITPATHSPLGLTITAERISLLAKKFVNTQPVVFDDLFDERGLAAGTSVTLKLPLLYESYPD